MRETINRLSPVTRRDVKIAAALALVIGLVLGSGLANTVGSVIGAFAFLLIVVGVARSVVAVASWALSGEATD
jgi:uncharacterized membrane protein HdeD (DUF308 family)